MITREVILLEQLAGVVPSIFPQHQPALEKYLICMRAWVRGNLDWSLGSARFSEIETPSEGREPGYVETILSNEESG